MKILTKQNVEDIVFIDIETSYDDPDFDENAYLYDAWKYDFLKHSPDATKEEIIEGYFSKASLSAEYGIIICITMGVVKANKIFLKTFYGEERNLLVEFKEALERTVSLKSWLCGHTITGFDGPFITKRCLINAVPLHNWFDVAHLKPWELPYLDIATLWKGTGFKASSLISMSACLGVPSPKDDISGKDVPKLFHEGDIKRICLYCEKDVIAVINLFMRLCYKDLLEIDLDTLSTQIDVLTYLINGGEYNDKIKINLEQFINSLTALADRKRAVAILNAIPSKAKGKITHVTKKDIKDLNVAL